MAVASYEQVLAEYLQTRTSMDGRDGDRFRQLCKTYLTSQPAEARFRALDQNVYRWLKRLVSDENYRPDVLLKLKEGFGNLEHYALNLWRWPWRKEFHLIKVNMPSSATHRDGGRGRSRSWVQCGVQSTYCHIRITLILMRQV